MYVRSAAAYHHSHKEVEKALERLDCGGYSFTDTGARDDGGVMLYDVRDLQDTVHQYIHDSKHIPCSSNVVLYRC